MLNINMNVHMNMNKDIKNLEDAYSKIINEGLEASPIILHGTDGKSFDVSTKDGIQRFAFHLIPLIKAKNYDKKEVIQTLNTKYDLRYENFSTELQSAILSMFNQR